MRPFVTITPDDINKLHGYLLDQRAMVIHSEYHGMEVSLILATTNIGGIKRFVAYDCLTKIQVTDSDLCTVLCSLNLPEITNLQLEIAKLPESDA